MISISYAALGTHPGCPLRHSGGLRISNGHFIGQVVAVRAAQPPTGTPGPCIATSSGSLEPAHRVHCPQRQNRQEYAARLTITNPAAMYSKPAWRSCLSLPKSPTTNVGARGGQKAFTP